MDQRRGATPLGIRGPRRFTRAAVPFECPVGVAQLAERLLPKQEAASSILATHSTRPRGLPLRDVAQFGSAHDWGS